MARIAATTLRLTTFCRMATHQTRAFQHVLALCDNWSSKILLGTSKPLKSIFSTWPSASQIGPLKYFCWGLCSSFVLWPFSCWFLTIHLTFRQTVIRWTVLGSRVIPPHCWSSLLRFKSTAAFQKRVYFENRSGQKLDNSAKKRGTFFQS